MPVCRSTGRLPACALRAGRPASPRRRRIGAWHTSIDRGRSVTAPCSSGFHVRRLPRRPPPPPPLHRGARGAFPLQSRAPSTPIPLTATLHELSHVRVGPSVRAPAVFRCTVARTKQPLGKRSQSPAGLGWDRKGMLRPSRDRLEHLACEGKGIECRRMLREATTGPSRATKSRDRIFGCHAARADPHH